MEPENDGFQKESPFSRGRFSGSMLNFRGVNYFWNFFQASNQQTQDPRKNFVFPLEAAVSGEILCLGLASRCQWVSMACWTRGAPCRFQPKKLVRWFQIFVVFTHIWGFFPFWLYNMFQRGWFNHQLEKKGIIRITYPPLNQQIAMENSHLFLVDFP